MSKTVTFLLLLFSVLLITFFIHIGILFLADMPVLSNKIVLCYAVNFLMAAGIFIGIQQTLKKNGTYAGFIFMAGSAAKFLIFFVVIYPFYQQDGIMQTSEFTAFFMPYALCLILEVGYLSKQLNNQSYSEENSPNNHPTNSEEKKN